MAEVEIPPFDTRPERSCLGCGKRDKSYRDVITLSDGNAAFYHADCHVVVANCDVCKKVLEAAGTDETSDGLKDEELHVAIHEAMAAKKEVFTSEAVVPQDLPNAE